MPKKNKESKKKGKKKKDKKKKSKKSKKEERKKSKSKSKKKSKSGDSKELKEGDFVELDYVGREKDGEVFDTNVKEEAKKMGLNIENRPVAICLGQNMILPAIDKFLIGKEADKEYHLELTPDKAFGERKQDLVKTMPMAVFKRHEVNPRRGMAFNFDGRIGKIKAVSGGRVIVDFNNPMASKNVEYDLKIKKKITNKERQVGVTIKSLLGKEPDFEIKQEKIIVKTGEDEQLNKVIDLYKDKLKDILDMDIEVEGPVKGNDKEEEKEEKNKKDQES